MKPLELTVCSQTNCERKHHARGLCKAHHQGLLRNGTPTPLVEQFRGPAKERLLYHSTQHGGCRRWEKTHTSDGYGQVRHEGAMRKVHRVAWEVFIGPIPAGAEVDHKCHVRDCINPDHLRLTVHKQNAENRAGLRSTNTSGVNGVVKRPNGRYQGSVVHHGKRYTAGTFDSIAEAEAAVIALRNKLFTHNDIDRLPHYDEPTETGNTR